PCCWSAGNGSRAHREKRAGSRRTCDRAACSGGGWSLVGDSCSALVWIIRLGDVRRTSQHARIDHTGSDRDVVDRKSRKLYGSITVHMEHDLSVPPSQPEAV